MGACSAAGLVAAQRFVQPTAVQKKQEPVFGFQGTTIKTPDHFTVVGVRVP